MSETSEAQEITVGSRMRYVGPRGRVVEGTVVEALTVHMANIETGEEFEGRKFRIYDEATQRLVWTLAMRPSREIPS